jgi:NADH-quinone oxidoreductase subunit M
MLRAYQNMMHGETNTLTETFGEITFNEKLLLGCLVVLVIFFGIFPNIILNVSEPQVKQLIDQVQNAVAIVKH